MRGAGSPESRQEIGGAASPGGERPGGERCGQRRLLAVEAGATTGPTETIAGRPHGSPESPRYVLSLAYGTRAWSLAAAGRANRGQHDSRVAGRVAPRTIRAALRARKRSRRRTRAWALRAGPCPHSSGVQRSRAGSMKSVSSLALTGSRLEEHADAAPASRAACGAPAERFTTSQHGVFRKVTRLAWSPPKLRVDSPLSDGEANAHDSTKGDPLSRLGPGSVGAERTAGAQRSLITADRFGGARNELSSPRGRGSI